MKTDTGISTGQLTEYIRPELKPKAGFFQPPRTQFYMLMRRCPELVPLVLYILSELQFETPRREFASINLDQFLDLTGDGERAIEKKLHKAEALKLVRRQYPGRRFTADRGGYQVDVSLDTVQAIPLRCRQKGWHVAREVALVARSAIAACKLEKANFSSFPEVVRPADDVSLELVPDDVILAEAEKRKAYLSPVPEKSEPAAGTNLSSPVSEVPQIQQGVVETISGANLSSLVESANFDPSEYEVECPKLGWHPLYRIRKNQTLAREPVPETPEQRLANIRSELEAVQRDIVPRLGPPSPKTVANFAEYDPTKHSSYIGRTCADIVRPVKNDIETWGLAFQLYKQRLGNTS